LVPLWKSLLGYGGAVVADKLYDVAIAVIEDAARLRICKAQRSFLEEFFDAFKPVMMTTAIGMNRWQDIKRDATKLLKAKKAVLSVIISH
jgi:hypothetical protein